MQFLAMGFKGVKSELRNPVNLAIKTILPQCAPKAFLNGQVLFL